MLTHCIPKFGFRVGQWNLICEHKCVMLCNKHVNLGTGKFFDRWVNLGTNFLKRVHHSTVVNLLFFAVVLTIFSYILLYW